MHQERPPKPRLSLVTSVVLIGALLSAPALPHGGGLNSAGCHNDYVSGGYHCHRGGGGASSIDSDVVLAVLVAGGIAYFVHKLKKKERDPDGPLCSSGLARSVEVPKGDPIGLGLMPARNRQGRVDGVAFQLRFRF